MKPLQTTVKDVLREAIESEVETREYLTRLADRASSPAVRTKLLELADRELMHRAKLERKYRDTFGEDPPNPPVPRVEIPREIQKLDIRKALKIVLEHERESESNYRFLAERVPNTELGSLFMELAEIEWKHKVEAQRDYDNSVMDPEEFLLDI
ncbi:MAG TPA: ferritin family protein [Thermoanaerobaculia bacterium]|nr:ferritin family protein [Thermoanaerobaculia bacterium]